MLPRLYATALEPHLPELLRCHGAAFGGSEGGVPPSLSTALHACGLVPAALRAASDVARLLLRGAALPPTALPHCASLARQALGGESSSGGEVGWKDAADAAALLIGAVAGAGGGGGAPEELLLLLCRQGAAGEGGHMWCRAARAVALAAAWQGDDARGALAALAPRVGAAVGSAMQQRFAEECQRAVAAHFTPSEAP